MPGSIFFILTVSIELLALALIAISLRWPQRRFWPPPPEALRRGTLAITTMILSVLGTLTLGVSDWGTISVPWWVRLAIGLPLTIAGLGLARWAIGTLGRQAATGGTPGLNLRGPYQFCRNPQYQGFLIALAGWILLSASRLTWISAALSVPLLLALPRAEEPWLAAQYGDPYLDYLSAVPRFFTFRKRRPKS